MKADEVKLNEVYCSAENPIAIASNCRYEVIKKNKTTCWVKLVSSNFIDLDGKTIYKNIPYRSLAKIKK